MKFLETSDGTFVNFEEIQDFHYEYSESPITGKEKVYSKIRMKDGTIHDLFDVPGKFGETFSEDFEGGDLIEWHAEAIKYALLSSSEVIRIQQFEDETWNIFYEHYKYHKNLRS